MSEYQQLPIWPPSSQRFIPYHVPATVRKDQVWFALFATTSYYYVSRYFRHDRNILRLGLFIVLNAAASDGYAKALVQPAMSEAILINNAKELEFCEKTGKKMPVI